MHDFRVVVELSSELFDPTVFAHGFMYHGLLRRDVSSDQGMYTTDCMKATQALVVHVTVVIS